MRIAVTGTHGSGKTTLIDDFLDMHREYEHKLEPYWSLVQQGVVFSDGPSIDDLEEQLAWSVRMILERSSAANVIFDRCPIDYVAYLEVLTEQLGSEWVPSGKLLGGIEKAMAALDLVVFLPLASPDDIDVAIEYPKLRKLVDARLKLLIRDQPLEFFATGNPNFLELQGRRQDRVRDLDKAIV
jgi:AAA domain